MKGYRAFIILLKNICDNKKDDREWAAYIIKKAKYRAKVNNEVMPNGYAGERICQLIVQ